MNAGLALVVTSVLLALALVALMLVSLAGLRRRRAEGKTAAAHAAQLAAREEEAAGRAQHRAEGIVAQAEREAERIVVEAEQARLRAEEPIRVARDELRELRAAHDRREERIAAKEDRLEAERGAIETKSIVIERIRSDLAHRAVSLGESEREQRQELSRIAGLTEADARQELLAKFEHDARLQAATHIREIERDAAQQAERRARHLLVGAMQRVAADQTSESAVAAVDLPSEDMKGRIIGREGRNIRAFEQVTGVNLIIDDTPGLVLLSCFDPVRREVARLALDDLVQDGRIHPTRIEAAHERAATRVDEVVQRAAEDAVAEMGITDLHPDLYPTLGALRFRTSYGQNVLRHLLECGHLAAVLASELGLDPATCRRAAFLHDIGKALTHEAEGSHALVGAELLRRHGEHEDIVHAVAAHHNEVEPRTVEAILVQVCDAVSGSRPGARRESLESYVQRLERMEAIAQSHEGVDRVYAMQAGRDIRVMVRPEVVDDEASAVMAREIAAEIERELTYPGQIRVTVVRESRATGIAR